MSPVCTWAVRVHLGGPGAPGRSRCTPNTNSPPSQSTALRTVATPGVAEGTRKEQTHRHSTVLDELDAPVSCSKRTWACAMARDRTVVPRSGRRGRRFKSCHPDSRLRRSQPCRGLRGQSQARPEGAKWNVEGTRGNHLQAIVGWPLSPRRVRAQQWAGRGSPTARTVLAPQGADCRPRSSTLKPR